MNRKRSGAWAKWQRAKSHLEALGNEIGPTPEYAYGWTKRYRATPEAHRGGREYRFYVDAEEVETEGWALLAGDCLFNLRSALDHLVYELHVRRYGTKLPRGLRSAFPILDAKPTGKDGRPADPAKWREIKYLSHRQRRAITWLQPYNRRNDKLRQIRTDLGVVDTLNNIDKHRHLHVLQATPLMAAVAWFGDPPGYGFRQESFLDVPLIGKTEVFRWTFDVPPPDISRYLDSGGAVRAYICLHEGGKNPILYPLLNGLTASVESILKRFAVFLR